MVGGRDFKSQQFNVAVQGRRQPGSAFKPFAGIERHKLNVTVNRIPLGDVDIADAILSHAADSAAEFLVMGGYGHSRLRESLFGGTTREILATMTLPVLMAH